MSVKVLNKIYSLIENVLNAKILHKARAECRKSEKEGWSFIVSTDGKNRKMLAESIISIRNEIEGKCDYEIILIGNIGAECGELSGSNIRLIKYIDVKMPKARGWITKKKNIAVMFSNYDKIVILHDYIKIDKGWFEGFVKFGNEFDVVCNKVKLKDGRRANDWVCWISEQYGLTQCCLPYDISIKGKQYVPGNYVVCKRKFFIEHPFDEKLKWGEGEDVKWSEEIQKYTQIVFNPNSSVSFLKEKADNWPPYCGSWIDMSLKAIEVFGSDCGMDDIIAASKRGIRLGG